jgi:hypothetical protein
MVYSATVRPTRSIVLSLQTPLIVIRWVLVLLAVLAWLIVIPIYELVALGYRALVRVSRGAGLRVANRLVPITARPKESPATRE